MIKNLTKFLFGIAVIGLIGIITLNYVFHFSRGHAELKTISEDYFRQVTGLIEKNQAELDDALEDFSDETLQRVKTV